MSYIPTQGGHSTFIPVKIRSGATVSTYPVYSQSPIFAIEPGTKYINVLLTVVSTTVENYHIRMAHALDTEPGIPNQFDLLRINNFTAGPPAYYEQSIYEVRSTSAPATAAPGATYIASFPLDRLNPKWGRIDVGCSNATSNPNVAISIVQGR